MKIIPVVVGLFPIGLGSSSSEVVVVQAFYKMVLETYAVKAIVPQNFGAPPSSFC